MLIPVALRKESVDRNSGLMSVVRFAAVALRKESVDRNRDAGGTESIYNESLSARRAWIEINRPKNQREKQEGRSPQGERG